MLSLSDIKRFSFAGGERHIEVTDAQVDDIDVNGIRAVLKSADDIMDLVLLDELLPFQGTLYLPYIPYARQDRATTPQTSFSMKAFARILNETDYWPIHVYEPHSHVAPALIEGCIVHDCDYAVSEFLSYLWSGKDLSNLLLFAPDAGAEKRVARIHAFVNGMTGVLPEVGQAIKHRNPATGRVEIGYITPNVAGRNVVVVDDICDGGATFLQLAPKLKDAGAKTLHLFVAHGIFSKGIDELRKHYDTIATTDSFYDGRFGDKVQVYYSI